MAVEAELKRRNQAGALVDWTINDDGTEPSSDTTTHDLLTQVLDRLTPQRYIHPQSTPDNVWTITHNLGLLPQVTIMNSAGQVVEGDINYISNDVVELTFVAQFSGIAILSA